MNMYFAISDLLKMNLTGLPKTKMGLSDKVERERWPFVMVDCKGGKNGKRREYAPPPDVMKQIQARKLEEALGGLADLPSPTEIEGKPAVRNEETSLALPETVCIVDGSTEQQRLRPDAGVSDGLLRHGGRQAAHRVQFRLRQVLLFLP
jgi:bacteriophage transposase A protein